MIRSSTIAITHRIMPVLSYVAHLAIILWWLLDRSPDQSATKALVALRRQLLPSVALTPHVAYAQRICAVSERALREGLLGEEGHPPCGWRRSGIKPWSVLVLGFDAAARNRSRLRRQFPAAVDL